MEPIVISEYIEISEQLDVVRDTANFLPDMTTKDGYEADKAHISNIRREAKECLMAFGIDEFSAKTIVLALHNGHIAHCKIIY